MKYLFAIFLILMTPICRANSNPSADGGTTVGNGRERPTAIKVQFRVENRVLRSDLKSEIMQILEMPFVRGELDQFFERKQASDQSIILCIHFKDAEAMKSVRTDICKAIKADNNAIHRQATVHSITFRCDGADATTPIPSNDQGC